MMKLNDIWYQTIHLLSLLNHIFPVGSGRGGGPGIPFIGGGGGGQNDDALDKIVVDGVLCGMVCDVTGVSGAIGVSFVVVVGCMLNMNGGGGGGGGRGGCGGRDVFFTGSDGFSAL